jgi:ABC-2 type transport system permease protein
MKWLSLASRNLKETYRDPLSLGLGIAMPCTLLVLFVSIGRRAPLWIFTPAGLAPAMAVFSFSMLIMFQAMLLAKDRSSGLFGRLRATPLEALDFALAYSLPYLPFALLQAAACLIVGVALGAPVGAWLALSLAVFVPTAFLCLGLGLVLGSLCSENQIAGLGSALVTALGVFSGAWFDVHMAGGIFETVGRILPFARAVDGARALARGASLASLAGDLANLWAFALLALSVGVLCLHTRTRA